MSDQDDARTPDDQPPVSSDADLVLEPQPVFDTIPPEAGPAGSPEGIDEGGPQSSAPVSDEDATGAVEATAGPAGAEGAVESAGPETSSPEESGPEESGPDTPAEPEPPQTPPAPEPSETPETPTGPEAPAGPEPAPEFPAAPDVPAEPELPEAPTPLEEPELPGTPAGPEIPGAPTEPALPETPAGPELPEAPEGPEVPELPGTPAEPPVSSPLVPVIPEVPAAPQAPAEPGPAPESPAAPAPEVPAQPDMWAAVRDRPAPGATRPHTDETPVAPEAPGVSGAPGESGTETLGTGTPGTGASTEEGGPSVPRSDTTGTTAAIGTSATAETAETTETTGALGAGADEAAGTPLSTSQAGTTTTSHRIPPIPAPVAAPGLPTEPPRPPSSVSGPDREDIPAPAPRDVLDRREHRGTETPAPPAAYAGPDAAEPTPHHASAFPASAPAAARGTDAEATGILHTPNHRADHSADEPTVAAMPALGDAVPAPTAAPTTAPAAAPVAAAAGAAASELEQTRIRRRSLMAPPQGVPDDQAETQWHPREGDAEPARPQSTPRSLDDAIFEGATVVPEVPSRTGAHVWGLIGSIVLVPLAWYLLADAGARMTVATNAPMTTGTVNVAALLELVGGLLALLVLGLVALRSSLGAYVTGVLVTVVGIPWVVLPGWTARTVLPAIEWLNSWNSFGANLAHHLQSSGYSGRLLALGVALLLVGTVSHRVRRRGRAEEALRAEVEKVNPEGAHLSWSARRRAAKAASPRGH